MRLLVHIQSECGDIAAGDGQVDVADPAVVAAGAGAEQDYTLEAMTAGDGPDLSDQRVGKSADLILNG